MNFKQLTDSQILALAIDEWLLDLSDEEWEEAIRHIEKRKLQRANRKADRTHHQSFHPNTSRSSITR